MAEYIILLFLFYVLLPFTNLSIVTKQIVKMVFECTTTKALHYALILSTQFPWVVLQHCKRMQIRFQPFSLFALSSQILSKLFLRIGTSSLDTSAWLTLTQTLFTTYYQLVLHYDTRIQDITHMYTTTEIKFDKESQQWNWRVNSMISPTVSHNSLMLQVLRR